MKNDKLVELIESTLRKVYGDTFKLKVFKDLDEGKLVYGRDNNDYPHFCLHFSCYHKTKGCMEIDNGNRKITIAELEAYHKNCVAIKDNIFKYLFDKTNPFLYYMGVGFVVWIKGEKFE